MIPLTACRKAKSGIFPHVREERTECGISLPEDQKAYYIILNNDIDYNGLRHGTYILYINVKEKFYSEKVTL